MDIELSARIAKEVFGDIKAIIERKKSEYGDSCRDSFAQGVTNGLSAHLSLLQFVYSPELIIDLMRVRMKIDADSFNDCGDKEIC